MQLRLLKTKVFWMQALRVCMWVSCLCVLLISLGFSGKQQEDARFQSLLINIDNSEGNFFLEKEDIRQLLKDKGDTILNMKVKEVDMLRLERILKSHASVENAEIYAGHNGAVKIDIRQRKPVVRIINSDRESYYLDDKGRPMPLSDKFTPNVLVVNGHLNEPYAKRYMYSVPEILQHPGLMEKTWLDDAWLLAGFIRRDDFWNAQIQQVYINSGQEIELVPRVGNHIIILGDLSGMEEKFARLMVFYREGLTRTDSWDKYSVINLKFKNQVVCTKK